MDGLLIAEQLRKLVGSVPAERRPWRFPDDRTAVLPLAAGLSLWLYSRPPQPVIEVRDGAPAMSAANTPFQEQLAARAVGDLLNATQPQLDRVVRLDFAAGDGFVPEPPLSLVAELTGRNANLVLVDEGGTILGVERLVSSERNRYRELRPGVRYLPPPPYQKIDPRTASADELAAALRGREARDVTKLIDGIGPQLFGALLARTPALEPKTELQGRVLHDLIEALEAVAMEPSAALAAVASADDERPSAGHGDASSSDLQRLRDQRQSLQTRASLRTLLARRLKLSARRVADGDKALAAAADAERMRAEADLLLANAAAFEPHGESVSLHDYEGGSVVITIDARLDAAGNAAARYQRAKRREARAKRALEDLPALRRELSEVESAVAGLADADEQELKRLHEQWGTAAGEAETGRRAAGNARSGARAHAGVRFVDPRGYEVFVGRSARENDAITFKLARSRDLWLHVQGYRGAHVVVRNQGRELPFDTVLFAARLAAGFSQARHSDNVPVDYTERKYVWRPKGAAAGAVNFSQNKTVYVTPARDDQTAAASS